MKIISGEHLELVVRMLSFFVLFLPDSIIFLVNMIYFLHDIAIAGNIKIFKYKIFYKGGAMYDNWRFFTMAAVIVAACLVYNFVKAYTKKK